MGTYSLARAKALLDLYGWVDRDGDGWRETPAGEPLVLVMNTQSDQVTRQTDQLWKKDMDALGLRVALKTQQWPENLKQVRSGKFMLWRVGSTAATPDGQGALERIYGGSVGKGNISRFRLPALDKVYDDMRLLPDGPERQKLFDEATAARRLCAVSGQRASPADRSRLPRGRRFPASAVLAQLVGVHGRRGGGSCAALSKASLAMAALPEPRIAHYMRWLEATRGLAFDPTTSAGYDALWRWSVGDLPTFWASIWDYFDIRSPTPWETVLVDEVMPGARWFPGAQVNYAQQVMRHAGAAHAAGHPAILFQNEEMRDRGELHALSWPELRRQVGALAAALADLGVGRSDRVCAFLPNTPQTAVAFLAVASLGAIWSICSPDMGPVAVLDRFRQIEPKALIACDGYRYGGIAFPRLDLLQALLEQLPSVRDVVLLRYLDPDADPAALAAPARRVHDFVALTAGAATCEPEWLPFDQPLWVVYSSGTTGLPKPIVHGHGGVILEALKLGLHNNLGPSVETGDRYHWYSATGWIMWNGQMSGLLGGTTICLYDGSPAGRSGAPDWTTLWRFVAATRTTFFGGRRVLCELPEGRRRAGAARGALSPAAWGRRSAASARAGAAARARTPARR